MLLGTSCEITTLWLGFVLTRNQPIWLDVGLIDTFNIISVSVDAGMYIQKYLYIHRSISEIYSCIYIYIYKFGDDICINEKYTYKTKC